MVLVFLDIGLIDYTSINFWCKHKQTWKAVQETNYSILNCSNYLVNRKFTTLLAQRRCSVDIGVRQYDYFH
jgi:hypothetical protein